MIDQSTHDIDQSAHPNDQNTHVIDHIFILALDSTIMETEFDFQNSCVLILVLNPFNLHTI